MESSRVRTNTQGPPVTGLTGDRDPKTLHGRLAIDAKEMPVAMIINSSELRAAGFRLKEVLPQQLESAARGGMRTRGAGLRRLQGMGPQRFLLNVDDDTEFRSRCE